MKYRVESHRLAWPEGSVLTAEELEGCNIDAWLVGGHLALVAEVQAAPIEVARATRIDLPNKNSKRTPVEPVPDDTAEEPEEQE